MPVLKKGALIVLVGANTKDPIFNLALMGMLQNTHGNADLPDMPHDDTQIQGLVTDMTGEYSKLLMKPPKSTSALVGSKVFNFCNGYNANKAYVQSQCRAKVVSTGDINLGIALAEDAGFFFKKQAAATNKIFKATPLGGGAAWIETKSVGRDATYIREFGYTVAKDTPPKEVFERLVGGETAFVLQGMDFAKIVGMREAMVLPIPRKNSNPTESTNVQAPATRSVSTDAHKRVFIVADGKETSNYTWSNWIYFVVL